MGIEIVAFVLSFAILAMLARLVGRLLSVLIQIALIVGAFYFLATHHALLTRLL